MEDLQRAATKGKCSFTKTFSYKAYDGTTEPTEKYMYLQIL